MSRFRAGAVAALAFFYLLCLLLSPRGALDALAMDLAFMPPSLAHPMGTDDLGRDMLEALAQGGRTSLLVASLTACLALLLGAAVGLVAALGPAALDEILMRAADIVVSLPALLFAILVAALFGGSAVNLALVLGLTRWPVIARLVRAEALVLRETDFVRASVSVGTPPIALAVRHIIPHASSAALSATGIVFGGAVLAESALAYVGLGDPRLTSWGQLIASGFAFVTHAWWMWAFPAAALCGASALAGLAADQPSDERSTG
ncbi:MAG: ABC transporter permease [Enhydrobacter sp.]|nr:ABC transporter permease [Enhydrobacter sp.]